MPNRYQAYERTTILLKNIVAHSGRRASNFLQNFRTRYKVLSSILYFVNLPIITFGFLVYLFVSMLSFFIMISLGVATMRLTNSNSKILERMLWWLSYTLSILILIFMSFDVVIAFSKSNLHDLLIIFILFLFVAWASVAIGAIILYSMRLTAKIMDESPLAQILAVIIVFCILISFISSSYIQDCDVVWTNRGSFCE